MKSENNNQNHKNDQIQARGEIFRIKEKQALKTSLNFERDSIIISKVIIFLNHYSRLAYPDLFLSFTIFH